MARILVLDDDPTILALVQLILSEAEHDVLVTTSVKEATAYLKHHTFDLVIVDLMMTEASGFDFVRMLKTKALSYKPYIAFLTSHSDRRYVEEATKLGADLYFVKPVVREAFLKKL